MNTRIGVIAAVACIMAIACPAAWPAPVLDGGWSTSDSDGSMYSDHIDAAGASSAGSPYVYTLTKAAVFRVTDVLAVGDIFTVTDNATLILTTTLQSFASGFGDNSDADGYWVDATHSKGEVLLAPGNHSITLSGNGLGGLPAHFYARIDTVPEPATVALLGLGIVGLLAARRRK